MDYDNNMKLFVWDFHGTLEKGNVKALHEILNKVAHAFNVQKQISFETTVHMYGLSWIDYFQYLHPQGTTDEWLAMKDKATQIQKKERLVQKHIQPMDHAVEVLNTIKKQGHDNIILSNSQPQWLRKFSEMVGIEKFIDDYIALDAHGESRGATELQQRKSNELVDFCQKKEYSRIIKIGDRESDIKAGKTVGAVTYFFRNQFNKDIQHQTAADYEITDLREVLKEV